MRTAARLSRALGRTRAVATPLWRASRRHLSGAAGGNTQTLSAHDRLVQKEFNMQAKAYAGKYTGDLQQTLGWVRDGLWAVLRPGTGAAGAGAGPNVLDVCSGTGAFTRLLAPHVSRVTALDLTPGMIAQAKDAYAADLKQRGLPASASNVEFVHGNAAKMPFVDASFDLVVSRFAVHHWSADTAPAIFSEMARVTRPGGTVAIVDIVNPFQYHRRQDVAVRLNDLERLRDPSHTLFQWTDDLRRLFTATNRLTLHPAAVVHERMVDLIEWLSTCQTPTGDAATITQALEAELADPKHVTGFRPFWRDTAAQPLPVTSSNVHAPSMAKAAPSKRLTFWHTDVLLRATKL